MADETQGQPANATMLPPNTVPAPGAGALPQAVPAPPAPIRAAAPAAPAATPEAPFVVEEDFSTYRRSDSIAKLSAALAKAQKQITNATRDSVNPHFKGNYASLAAVRNACKDALSDEGIAVYQPCTTRGRRVSVTTLLVLGDEWIESTLHLNCGADTPQAAGGGLTYARRYGLAAMVGVAPEDDDGNAATTAVPQGVRQDAGKKTELQQAQNTGKPTDEIPGPVNGAAAPNGPVSTPKPAAPPVARPTPRPAPPAPAPPAAAAAPAATATPPPPGMRPPAKAPGS